MLHRQTRTAKHYKLPIKVFVFSNRAYQIKWEQIVMEDNSKYGVDRLPIDFAQFADTCRSPGFILTETKDAKRVISQALSHDGPVVACLVDPNEPSLLGKVSTTQAIEFAKTLARDERDSREIIKNVVKNQFCEAIATKGFALFGVIPGL